ncbi:MAG: hypothetical protein K6C99_00195 [Lachnospiraceae bacterium]|nr:hypothetical protein [Lachnospiraceae bacterium]
MLISAIILIIMIVILPLETGRFLERFDKGHQNDTGMVFLSGFLLQLVLFFPVALGTMFFIRQDNFVWCTRIYLILSCIPAIAGAVCRIRKLKEKKPAAGPERKAEVYKNTGEEKNGKFRDAEKTILWAAFFIILAYQLYKAVTTAFIDGDNTFYVTQSLIAQQQGVMFTNLPYTGGPTSLDMRHALAVLPLWFAYLAKVSGIHATVLCKTVMPLFLIPFTYLVFFEIAKRLYPEEKNNIPFFLCLVAVFEMFGSVSIYTSERFFLTRTWQGKAMLGSVVIPVIILALLMIAADIRDKSNANIKTAWYLIVSAGIFSGICTSLGVAFSALLTLGGCLVIAIRDRKPKLFAMSMLACIPQAVYMVLYVILK